MLKRRNWYSGTVEATDFTKERRKWEGKEADKGEGKEGGGGGRN
jgi:hypothetical protein